MKTRVLEGGTCDITQGYYYYSGNNNHQAVDIVKMKMAGHDKIRIISDYDVDGICSGYI